MGTLLEFVNPHPNPNGISSFSLGLAHRAYPGSNVRYARNPEGVAANVRPVMPQPRWGWSDPKNFPKVGAKARQPWAGGHNPFGIGRRVPVTRVWRWLGRKSQSRRGDLPLSGLFDGFGSFTLC